MFLENRTRHVVKALENGAALASSQRGVTRIEDSAEGSAGIQNCVGTGLKREGHAPAPPRKVKAGESQGFVRILS